MLGADEGQGATLLRVEEVGGAEVTVALLVVGVDRGGLDGDRDRGLQRVLGGDELATELVERAPDLAHQVPGGEGDGAVRRVDGPGAGGQGWGLRCAMVMRCSSIVIGWLIERSTTINIALTIEMSTACA